MSNIVPFEQSNFAQGMNLGTKQDSSFEQGQFESVNWLENLNPNAILGELSTRKAINPGTTGVDTVTVSGEFVGMTEMSHSATTQESFIARHSLGTSTPTVKTSNIGKSGYDAGVWSSGGDFGFQVSDYDVYGESFLMVSNINANDGNTKRKAVYAYTYTDTTQRYSESNSDGYFYLNGVTERPSASTRWEVLDTVDLASAIEAVFSPTYAVFTGLPIGTTNNVFPSSPIADYYTPEMPHYNGKMVEHNQLGYNDGGVRVAITPLKKSWKVKVGAASHTIEGYALSGDASQSWTGEFAYPASGVEKLVEDSKLSGRSIFKISTTDNKKSVPFMRGIYDYRKQNTPRLFSSGEKVPYYITAVINGVEQVIKKDIYTVFSLGVDDIVGDLVSYTTGKKSLFIQPNLFGGVALTFNIRIKCALTSIPPGLSEVRLYIANKNIQDKGVFTVCRSPMKDELLGYTDDEVNVDSYNGWIDVPESIYRTPDSDREQFSYSLAKSFVLFGDPSVYKRGATETDHSNFGTNNVSVNEWEQTSDGIVGKNGVAQSFFPPIIGLPDLSALSPPAVRTEFYIWDYMDRTAEPLATNIQGALFPWKGVGAATVTNLRGVSFIAGCLDKQGKLEPGLIRKSLLQSAVQSTDIFVETDFLKVGNETHTALTHFREQLWAFSKTQIHRIQFRNIAELASAEVLDVFSGNGTYSPKTVCVTPYGVAWCSEAGIWLSNGQEPELLSKAIEPLYLAIANKRQYRSTSTANYTWSVSGDASEYNRSMQILYDPEEYEIVFSTRATRTLYRDPTSPVDLDFRLIYSIVYKNWRIETIPIAMAGESFGKYHKTHFARVAYKSAHANGSTITVHDLSPTEYKDYGTQGAAAKDIRSSLILHEIGNGVKDLQLNRITTETSYVHNSNYTRPELYLYTRDRTNQFVGAGLQNIPQSDRADDVIAYYMDDYTDVYWLNKRIDTPFETVSEANAASLETRQNYMMTSQVHQVPFMRPIRRMYIEYVVNGWSRMRSIGAWLRVFERRMWG